MFSIGFSLFVICFIIGVGNASRGRKASVTVSGVTGWGVVIGIILMTISIVIKLWEVLP